VDSTLASTSVVQYAFEITAVCEFVGAVSTAVTPMARDHTHVGVGPRRPAVGTGTAMDELVNDWDRSIDTADSGPALDLTLSALTEFVKFRQPAKRPICTG